ncbi:immunoglobulin domain-containing protein, partial [Sphingobacterium faecale]
MKNPNQMWRNIVSNFRLTVVFIIMVLVSGNVVAQIHKPFAPRAPLTAPEKKFYNVKGDFTMLGNTNLTLETYSNTTDNGNSWMKFVDIDNDASTTNSSSANLEYGNGISLPCTKIVWAGLYWTGRAGPSEENFEVQIGNKILDKRKVRLKVPGSSAYVSIQALSGDIFYSTSNDARYRQMYAGFADITQYVKDLPNAGVGTYVVADIATKAGLSDGTGNFGGWGMVVIYENPNMAWRDITVFDGYAHVSGPANGTHKLEIDGFRATQSGDVKVKLGIMAGEGDVDNTGDYFGIKLRNATGNLNTNSHWEELLNGGVSPSKSNFFNSSIYTGGNTRSPNYRNNTGIDIGFVNIDNTNNKFIDNNDTKTAFRYRSNGDTYAIFNMVFAVDAYVPEVEPNTTLTHIGGQAITDQHAPALEAVPDDILTYKIEIRNTGNEAIQNAIVNIPMPYTASYVSSSEVHHATVTPVSAPSFNSQTGIVTWNLGNLPKPANANTVLATLTLRIKVTADCYLLSNTGCPAFVILDGNVSGKGSITGTSLGDAGDFIFGYQTNTFCNNLPIGSPVQLKINPTSANCEGNEYGNKEILFCENEIENNSIPVSKIRNQFPAGTQFYSGINTTTFEGTGVLYNNNTPFPAVSGTYYGVPPRGTGSTCYFIFKIKVASIEGTPNVTNPTYCIGDETPLLSSLVMASTVGYQLFFYETATSTTPLDVSNLRPSTAAAQSKEYWVAQGTTTCIGERVPFTVNVIEGPKISTQPQDLILCEGSTASVSVTATGNNLTYAWEYYNGTTWSALPSAAYDEITINGSALTLTGASLAYNGGKVRVRVSNGNCSILSEEANVVVTPLPTVAVAGADQENCNVSSFTLAGNAPVVGTGLWSIVSGAGVIT